MNAEDVPPGPLLVDTDVFSFLLDRKGPYEAFSRLTVGHPVGMSFVSVGEVRAGFYKNQVTSRRRLDALEVAFRRFVVIMPNEAVVEAWARIYAKGSLNKGGLNDMWIAATAMAYEMPLATGNLKDFSAVAREFPALRLVHPDL